MDTEIPGTMPQETTDCIRRYPRLTAHIMAASLGYCTPAAAAMVLIDAKSARKNECIWIRLCYSSNPVPAVQQAFRQRHYHHGGLSDYGSARAIVDSTK